MAAPAAREGDPFSALMAEFRTALHEEVLEPLLRELAKHFGDEPIAVTIPEAAKLPQTRLRHSGDSADLGMDFCGFKTP